MRFRLGFLAGMATGYVLGAKAGTERYEQIRSAFGALSHSEPAQQIGDEVRQAATRAGHKLETRASDGVSRITGIVHKDEPQHEHSTLPPS